VNDTAKGLSILAMTTVAIFFVLGSDNTGWDLPIFVKGTASQQADVLRLQESILSGEDPTLNQEAAAAGLPNELSCYRGRISVNDEALSLDSWPYISVANQSTMYVRLIGRKMILEVVADTNSTARHVKNIPVDIAMQFSDINETKGSCDRKDLIISSLK
jgi:hypothetical protein